jgi:ribosome-associated toxin RatA of RatAB toxin-antitoxin module
MRQIKRSALVPVSPRQMFQLINDIESYPQFVPGCAKAQVLERGSDVLCARLTVGTGMLTTSFVTRNRLQPDQKIHMALVEGPLESLDGVWTLTPVYKPGTEEVLGCKVELELQFEVAAGLKGLAIGSMVERLAGSLVEAFVKRSAELAAP